MAKVKELIKAATVNTAIDKITGKVLGWAVKSNSSSKYYQVTTMIIAETREFFCDCEAKEWGYAGRCCHILAVKEVLVAKAALEQEEAAPVVAEPVEKKPAIHPTLEEYALREYTIKRPAKIEAPEYRWCPPGYIKQVALSIDTPAFPKAKNASCKRAKQFENMPLNGNGGFSLLKVS